MKVVEKSARSVASDLTLGMIDGDPELTEKWRKVAEKRKQELAQEKQEIRESYEREERNVQKIVKEYLRLTRNVSRSRENKTEMDLLMSLKEAIIRRNHHRILSLNDNAIDYLSGSDAEEFQEKAKNDQRKARSEAKGWLMRSAIARQTIAPDMELRKEKMIEHNREEIESYFQSLSMMTPSERMNHVLYGGMNAIINGITEYGEFSKETGSLEVIPNTFLENLRKEN